MALTLVIFILELHYVAHGALLEEISLEESEG
jgi:hypothetical protein